MCNRKPLDCPAARAAVQYEDADGARSATVTGGIAALPPEGVTQDPFFGPACGGDVFPVVECRFHRLEDNCPAPFSSQPRLLPKGDGGRIQKRRAKLLERAPVRPRASLASSSASSRHP